MHKLFGAVGFSRFDPPPTWARGNLRILRKILATADLDQRKDFSKIVTCDRIGRRLAVGSLKRIDRFMRKPQLPRPSWPSWRPILIQYTQQ
jgi:hypothetical protein